MTEKQPAFSAMTTHSSSEGESFVQAIIDWFQLNARDLPWRGIEDGWQILVSEMMLQQTQVSRVIPKFCEWVRRWPRAGELARESAGEAVRVWGRLGYPRRALWLHKAACEIVERFHDEVPSDVEALESLTGVGPYTARAVAAFAYGKRVPVVDTNTRRVLARAVLGYAVAGAASPRDFTLQASYLPEDVSASVLYNAGIMELGALLCTAKSPLCEQCPVFQWCMWAQNGYPERLPERQASKQARFEGSLRQSRGRILQAVRLSLTPLAEHVLIESGGANKEQSARALHSLVADGLLCVESEGAESYYALPDH